MFNTVKALQIKKDCNYSNDGKADAKN